MMFGGQPQYLSNEVMCLLSNEFLPRWAWSVTKTTRDCHERGENSEDGLCRGGPSEDVAKRLEVLTTF